MGKAELRERRRRKSRGRGLLAEAEPVMRGRWAVAPVPAQPALQETDRSLGVLVEEAMRELVQQLTSRIGPQQASRDHSEGRREGLAQRGRGWMAPASSPAQKLQKTRSPQATRSRTLKEARPAHAVVAAALRRCRQGAARREPLGPERWVLLPSACNGGGKHARTHRLA